MKIVTITTNQMHKDSSGNTISIWIMEAGSSRLHSWLQRKNFSLRILFNYYFFYYVILGKRRNFLFKVSFLFFYNIELVPMILWWYLREFINSEMFSANKESNCLKELTDFHLYYIWDCIYVLIKRKTKALPSKNFLTSTIGYWCLMIKMYVKFIS